MSKDYIINRITELREKARLSARKLSMEIDLNEGYINRLENTRDFLPSVEVLLRIIEVCGVSVEEFFYSNPKTYKQDKELLDLLGNMTADKKEALIAFIKKQ